MEEPWPSAQHGRVLGTPRATEEKECLADQHAAKWGKLNMVLLVSICFFRYTNDAVVHRHDDLLSSMKRDRSTREHTRRDTSSQKKSDGEKPKKKEADPPY